jgi:hypothetical protein
MVQHTVLAIPCNNMHFSYYCSAFISRVTESNTILGFVCTPDHDNFDNCKSPGCPDVVDSSANATTDALSDQHDSALLELAMLI